MTLYDRLTAVREACLAFSLRIESASPETPIDTFLLDLDRIDAAVQRVRTLAVMHPDLNLTDALPRGATTVQDLQLHRQSEAILRQLQIPTVPVSVRLTASPLYDDTLGDTVRQKVDGQWLLAQPYPDSEEFNFTLDVGDLITQLTTEHEDLA